MKLVQSLLSKIITIYNGLGSAVAEVLAENIPTPLKRIGIQDQFGQSGDPELLYKDNHMTTSDICQSVENTLLRKNKNIKTM